MLEAKVDGRLEAGGLYQQLELALEYRPFFRIC